MKYLLIMFILFNFGCIKEKPKVNIEKIKDDAVYEFIRCYRNDFKDGIVIDGINWHFESRLIIGVEGSTCIIRNAFIDYIKPKEENKK